MKEDTLIQNKAEDEAVVKSREEIVERKNKAENNEDRPKFNFSILFIISLVIVVVIYIMAKGIVAQNDHMVDYAFRKIDVNINGGYIEPFKPKPSILTAIKETIWITFIFIIVGNLLFRNKNK